MRKALAPILKCVTAPATFPGMPVRVWNGNNYEERTVSPAPTPRWWTEPDAWVWHPTSSNVREGILWAHDRWHLSSTHWVETCQIKSAFLPVAEIK